LLLKRLSQVYSKPIYICNDHLYEELNKPHRYRNTESLYRRGWSIVCSGGFYFSMTSFIIHLDSLNLLDKLSDEQAGQLFKAIRNYQNSGELPSEFWLQIALEPFVNQFTRDAQKYAEISAKRSELGRKGGLAKASNSYQKLAKPSKPSYNDSDSKSNSDSKNDSSNANALSSEKKTEKEKLMLPHSSDEFKSAWESLLTQKKWKNKSDKALQIALKKLGSKAEKVAVKMIENAILGEWQGLFDLKPHEEREILEAAGQRYKLAPASEENAPPYHRQLGVKS